MGVTAGIVGFADLNKAIQERPHLVRLSRADLRRRINGDLSLRYEAPGLTSFAGLELIARFLRALDFKGHLRGAPAALPASDFGSVPMMLLVLVIVTNKPVSGRTLWFFLCGRGTHEKVYGELKGGFAFDCVPTQRYEANSASQIMSILAFNLMRALQTRTTERRGSNRKRRTIRLFQSIHTLRYQFINRAGLLVRPDGRSTLDVGSNAIIRERFQAVERAIAA